MPRFIKFRAGIFGILLSWLPLPLSAVETPLIAAASSIKPALEEIAEQFQSATGVAVRLSFGSSGNIYRQILQGAPFEVFFSADEDFVLKLAQADRTLDQGALYASGRLVLFVPHGSKLAVDEQIVDLKGDLKTALADGRIQRFAIANPKHAPYGQAAKQVLQALGLWELIEAKLVLGENVAQAAQFAISGSAQGGLFAYSLALSPQISARGQYALLPEILHQPLKQRVVLLKNASPTAQDFYDYAQQAAAQAIFRRYGFALPDE